MPKNWFEENAPKDAPKEGVPVISPEGEPGLMPYENIQAAQERGFKLASRVTSPEGESYFVPSENVGRAIKEHGFTLDEKQPARFPQYSPVDAGIKRPDLGEKYKEDTKAGPFTKPGAAEAATDVSGEGLKTAAIGTAAGVLGAGPAAAAVEASPVVAGGIATGAKWAMKNPIVAGLGYHIARELGIPLPKVLDVLSKFKE